MLFKTTSQYEMTLRNPGPLSIARRIRPDAGLTAESLLGRERAVLDMSSLRPLDAQADSMVVHTERFPFGRAGGAALSQDAIVGAGARGV